MHAYWPEHKMPALPRVQKDITVNYKGINYTQTVWVNKEPTARKAKVHWDASLILGKDVACGFVATRSITNTLDVRLVTCRQCRSLALICGEIK